MSLGKVWKARLDAAKRGKGYEASQTAIRATEMISRLQMYLVITSEPMIFVDCLRRNEVTEAIKNNVSTSRYTTTRMFRGAAAIVVKFCLKNDLDVYVNGDRPGDAELWVTPKGVPSSFIEYKPPCLG